MAVDEYGPSKTTAAPGLPHSHRRTGEDVRVVDVNAHQPVRAPSDGIRVPLPSRHGGTVADGLKITIRQLYP